MTAPVKSQLAPRRLSSPAEVQIDGVFLTQISGVWGRVRVVGRRHDGRFDIVRGPRGGSWLDPRAWTQLRRERPPAAPPSPSTFSVTSGGGAVCLTIPDDPRGGSLTRAVSPDFAVRFAAELLFIAERVSGRDLGRLFRQHLTERRGR